MQYRPATTECGGGLPRIVAVRGLAGYPHRSPRFGGPRPQAGIWARRPSSVNFAGGEGPPSLGPSRGRATPGTQTTHRGPTGFAGVSALRWVSHGPGPGLGSGTPSTVGPAHRRSPRGVGRLAPQSLRSCAVMSHQPGGRPDTIDGPDPAAPRREPRLDSASKTVETSPAGFCPMRIANRAAGGPPGRLRASRVGSINRDHASGIYSRCRLHAQPHTYDLPALFSQRIRPVRRLEN